MHSQIEIKKNVFLYKDPAIESLETDTIILIHNDPELSGVYAKILSNYGYEVIRFFDLFPPIREYTQEEINTKLLEQSYDVIMEIDFKSIDERNYNTGSAGAVTKDIAIYSSAEKSYIKKLTLLITIKENLTSDPWFVVESTEKGGSTVSTVKNVSRAALSKAIKALEKNGYLK